MFKNFLRSIQSFFGGMHVDELPGFRRFTQQAAQSILLAQEESRRFQHQYVGTEQILVGLLAQETGIASQVLRSMGVELEPVRQAIEDYIGHGSGTPEQILFTPRTIRVVEIALKQAKQLKHS